MKTINFFGDYWDMKQKCYSNFLLKISEDPSENCSNCCHFDNMLTAKHPRPHCDHICASKDARFYTCYLYVCSGGFKKIESVAEVLEVF